jgi:hypothetical protein
MEPDRRGAGSTSRERNSDGQTGTLQIAKQRVVYILRQMRNQIARQMMY